MVRGRPTAYKEEYPEQARKLCMLGATDYDLAEFFKVNRSTIALWKITHEAFSNAIKSAKDEADTRVERSLYERATGYSFHTEKVFCKDGGVTKVPVVEHVPPETAACIFWLKNRKKAEWRDKQEVEVDSSDRLSELLAEISGKTRGLPSDKR